MKALKKMISFCMITVFTVNIIHAQQDTIAILTAHNVTITGKYDSLKNGFDIDAYFSSVLGNNVNMRIFQKKAEHRKIMLQLDSVLFPVYLQSFNCYNLNWPFRDSTGKIIRDTMMYRKYNPESNLSRVSSFKYFVEPGDNIGIIESDGIIRYGNRPGDYYHQLVFSGAGAAKYDLIQKLDNSERVFRRTNNRLDFSMETNTLIDSLARAQLRLVEVARLDLSSIAYTIIRADILAYYEGVKQGLFMNSMKDRDSDNVNLLKSYKDDLWEIIRNENLINTAGIMYSSKFSQMLLDKYNLDSCLIPKKMFDLFNCYQYIKVTYQGELREKLLALLVTDDRNRDQPELLKCVNDALSLIKNIDLRKVVETKRNELVSSLYNYDFSVVSANGETVKLSNFKNKVVVIDFWFTGCGACRELAPQMQNLEKKLAGSNVVFLSVNTDKFKQRWEIGLKSGLYSSSYAMNLNTAPLGDNHPLIRHLNVQGYPTVLLFDKEGKQIIFDNPQLDTGKDLELKIKKLLKNN